MLIAMITYKAIEQGIDVQITEEAYTSKASFMDRTLCLDMRKGKQGCFLGNGLNGGYTSGRTD